MSKRSSFPAPMVVRDIPDYISPVTLKPIGSRSARREDLKRADCVEWEPGIGKGRYARTPGVVNNPKNAGRGLPLSDKGQELLEKQRREAKERK